MIKVYLQQKIHLHPSVPEETNKLEPGLILEMVLASQHTQSPSHAERKVFLPHLVDVMPRDSDRRTGIVPAFAAAVGRPESDEGVHVPSHLDGAQWSSLSTILKVRSG